MDEFRIDNKDYYGQNCFYTLNSQFNNNKNKKYEILIRKNRIPKDFLEEDINIFIKNSIKASIIPLELNEDDNFYIFKYIIDENIKYKMNHSIITGMILRTIYEFPSIAKHFIELCKIKPRVDRFKLFTIAHNIAVKNELGVYFNCNHTLSDICKIISKKNINLKNVLDRNVNIYFKNAYYDKKNIPDLYKITEKNNYLNIYKNAY